MQQFNVNLERQLPASNRADGRIRGISRLPYSRTSGITSTQVHRQLVLAGLMKWPGTPWAAVLVEPISPRPTRYFRIPSASIFTASTTFGSAHYNSLQIKAETKTPRYGLYALIGYTYSRTYDSGYSDGLSTPIGAPYLPAERMAEAGLGALADQPEQQFHGQRDL